MKQLLKKTPSEKKFKKKKVFSEILKKNGVLSKTSALLKQLLSRVDRQMTYPGRFANKNWNRLKIVPYSINSVFCVKQQFFHAKPRSHNSRIRFLSEIASELAVPNFKSRKCQIICYFCRTLVDDLMNLPQIYSAWQMFKLSNSGTQVAFQASTQKVMASKHVKAFILTLFYSF